MKLVLQTAVYAPSVGGIETVARLLAEEFAAAGHEPVVLTDTPGPASQGVIPVMRQASLPARLATLRAADAVLMFGMSLRFVPLPVVLRRPIVVSHHTWYDAGAAAPLKRIATRLTRNVAASEAIAKVLGAPATVIPNPYDDRLFFRRREVERSRDLAFVGRLVPDKGLLLLIETLAELARDGMRPTLTIVGSGPEEARARAAAAAAGIERQVEWTGPQKGEDLALCLNRHRVLVVPSLWNEPFGVIALEGAACGCTVVGSSGGGLPEAIGPCGQTFANGNAAALAEALRSVLGGVGAEPGAVEAHLHRHLRREVAQRYLQQLSDVAR